MSISQEVMANLPMLRRYARALTGSQASGDNYVVAVLEVLTKDPALLKALSTTRASIFKLFTDIWKSVGLNDDTDPPALKPEDRKITQIAPLPRQAFLLVSLESFSSDEAAQILSVTPSELKNLIDECGRDLASQIATDVLIIEDEALIAMDLESLVQSLGHNVVGVARTHKEAVELGKTKQPGLILADIQLADNSSGVDAVNELLNKFSVPVIFITAYPERFLTGMRPEPAFLITKPYLPAMVSAVISQALFFDSKAKIEGERAAE